MNELKFLLFVVDFLSVHKASLDKSGLATEITAFLNQVQNRIGAICAERQNVRYSSK